MRRRVRPRMVGTGRAVEREGWEVPTGEPVEDACDFTADRSASKPPLKQSRQGWKRRRR